MPKGFYLLISAQFASALADNALLIVTMAVLHERGLPAWWAPMLKFGFTVSYVVLAPFVGPLADAFPKAKLMAWMNGVKIVGVLALLQGLHPVLAFAVVGFGAAAYAPAKYGLITELVGPERLVAANGWLEVTVVCAALLGTVVGGVLVSALWLQCAVAVAARDMLGGTIFESDSALTLSIATLLLVYGLASALNIGVPDSGARYPKSHIRPLVLMREFWQANRTLWRDHDGGLSLAVTTIFWGVGATLQFAVLRWAGQVLQLPLSQAAYLQAAVAVGVIAGAVLAGALVPLHRAKRMLVAGVALGLMVPLMAQATSLWIAVPLLVVVGAVGGLMVVPLNALLQHRGYVLLTAGRSIAVQGFNENASVLCMLAVYAALVNAEVPMVALLSGFGLCIAAVIALLMRSRRYGPAPLEVPAPL